MTLPAPDYRRGDVQLWRADCLEILPLLPAGAVEACVTDPPYGLSFMGKDWDHGIPGVPYWSEVLRVLKPGAHLLAFGGTRTHHRLMVAIEEAGFEIRDCLMWLYGQGFPKSLDVSKAIDREADQEPIRTGRKRMAADGTVIHKNGSHSVNEGWGRPWMDGPEEEKNTVWETVPATDAARHWQGWGTALKPAWEPIILARRPLDGTVAENVLRHGTGGLNIDACRVKFASDTDKAAAAAAAQRSCQDQNKNRKAYGEFNNGPDSLGPYLNGLDRGRWPANVVHDGSAEVVGMFPETASGTIEPHHRSNGASQIGTFDIRDRSGEIRPTYGDMGSAARFFYASKASPEERGNGNSHPTVKPLSLCEWLVRMVAREPQIVIDPFMGSGTTGVACAKMGCGFIGIERERKYLDMAAKRIDHALDSFALYEPVARAETRGLFGEGKP